MMWFKNPQDEKLKQMLKASRQDFKFDQQSLRFRILQNLKNSAQPQAKFGTFAIGKYALALAVVVVFFSASVAYTSNTKPGETLFIVNKWREQVILSLPIPQEQKIDFETQMVTKRLEALDMVNKEQDILETLKESDESLNSAVEKIISNKTKVKASGDEKKERILNEALEKLEAEAAKRERKIQKLEDEAKDDEAKAQIRKHREHFEKTRAKARSEIENNEDDSD